MKDLSGSDMAKKNAAEKACELVKDGMIVGLGTGSTAAHAIRLLGRRVREDGLGILGVPTSYASEALAIGCGIALTDLNTFPELDIAIDGADQIDTSLNAIKGGGAAHTREKIVSSSAKQFVIVIDEKKFISILDRPVPVEVIPYARKLVERELTKIGGACAIRAGTGKDGPTITENGNLVMDCSFGQIVEPAGLSQKMSNIPGLVGHGIFTNADIVYIGSEEQVRRIERKK